jgi:hypothetical protein
VSLIDAKTAIDFDISPATASAAIRSPTVGSRNVKV